MNHITDISEQQVAAWVKPRKADSNKRDFGHSFLVCGGLGKIGAALLASRGCLRTGTGLLTVHVPKCGYVTLQTALPEAMVNCDPENDFISFIPADLDKYSAVGIGPGIGMLDDTKKAFEKLMRRWKGPMVIDADALNLLASDPKLMEILPKGAVLTPHMGEFRRLVGECNSELETQQKLIELCGSTGCVVVLKGHRTLIGSPEGKLFANTSGNPGMAKGGSGDALTGMITALLAQGYSSLESAIIGVYIHGAAGDLAAEKYSEQSMLPSDLIECIGEVFKRL